MTTLRGLLIHARVNGWHARRWFTGAKYASPHLWLHQPPDVVAMVTRWWGPSMRELDPLLEIRTWPTEAVPPSPAIKGHRYGQIKDGPWKQRLLGGDDV